MVHYPVSEYFYLTICTVKCGLVSEWVTRTNPFFLINKILNFTTVVIFQIFHLFIQKIATSLEFFCSFAKYSLFRALERMFESSLVQTSTIPRNSVQFFCAVKPLFCGFVHFWSTKWVSLNFAI